MEFWHGFLLITSVHLLAAASPGPDFVLVSQQTLAKGRRTGLICSLGITLGLAVHIIYSVLGLATVIAHSQPLLTTIKWLGGGYLIYLGWQGIQAKPKKAADLAKADPEVSSSAHVSQDTLTSQTIPTTKETTIEKSSSNSESTFATLRRGFLCNVFNPKAPVYFVAIFTLVLSPDIPLWQLAIYGVWMMVLQMAWFSTVVMLLSIPAVHRRFQRFEHWIDRVLGTAMIVLGLNLILRHR
ncbi:MULTISPECIES: LysE family translocator [unclassified Psychrobacter]|uniref:LysE family translocator n=1 Tax=unclassified Psychrobacter TaxID=196806 RepID=UPI000C341CE1|nr:MULTISPECIES: LysE family transporter [unclassified Psychrobacter]MBA6243411.1 LysE family transporter [Psychrobacter sp. Urea-trap-18]MBA6286028.1 LysE family transporter [Psychrobacter sp. Urea-trap-16]MBA6318275.1 LysE family transporter [Psychrobacter sp. Urea-trap-20]MBA6333681.1 LysE family transporter [Psychrobacter sp. Urea-trap-19]PKG61282.1 MFS transporter [Psychrobacter sp. Choline-3u-12]